MTTDYRAAGVRFNRTLPLATLLPRTLRAMGAPKEVLDSCARDAHDGGMTTTSALHIEGPFGPDGYTVEVINIIVQDPGTYLVQGLRSDRHLPEVKELNPTGHVSFLLAADRIRTINSKEG